MKERLSPVELILENLRIIKGEYAESQINYVRVDELKDYLESSCTVNTCPLKIYSPPQDREKIFEFKREK